MKKLKLPIIEKINTSQINFNQNKIDQTVCRIWWLVIVTLIIFIILILELFNLTMIKGAYYRYIADNNRIKQINIQAPRGNIYDRNQQLIASSQYDKKIKDYKRQYYQSMALSSALGYLQISSQNDIKNDFCHKPILLGDITGKQGIEKKYDCILRGTKGKELIEIDAKGNKVKTITKYPPKKGGSITISLDAKLQNYTDEIIKKNLVKLDKKYNIAAKNIAVVASIPKTGEILLFYSYPTFDPNVFDKKNQKLAQQLIKDKKKPLFNRITQATYPSGSVIKPYIALGALEDNIINIDYQIEDTGFIKAGPIVFSNWLYTKRQATDGKVDVIKAIKRSNDIFFYKLGAKMTPEKIKKWLNIFGFGRKTGIGLAEEEGLIPSAFWKQEKLHDRWYLGDTYNLSIGQGYLLVTPLQINMALSAIANNGYLCQPKLLKNQPKINSFYNLINIDSKSNCIKLPIKQKNINIIKSGMRQACQAGGTAWPFFEFKVQNSKFKNINQLQPISTDSSQLRPLAVGCKTGTAESHLPSKIPHAWFTVFAPFDNPEIALTVMVEEAGEGSDVAAPIAKEILKYYFENRNSS